VPIYEFRCTDCDTFTEVLQKYEDPPPKCEKCTQNLKKTVSITSFRLKGGGWYKDGYSKGE